jgi:uncharacterized protein
MWSNRSRDQLRCILDTNIFVAAGFNPNSHSARLVEAVRSGRVELVWNETTRTETRKILNQIPPLRWQQFAGLFTIETRYDGSATSENFSQVADPDDRKFAALAAATGAVLVTNDDHLLSARGTLNISIKTPAEVMGT